MTFDIVKHLKEGGRIKRNNMPGDSEYYYYCKVHEVVLSSDDERDLHIDDLFKYDWKRYIEPIKVGYHLVLLPCGLTGVAYYNGDWLSNENENYALTNAENLKPIRFIGE